MRASPFALAAVLTLAISFPSRAAEKPPAAQGNQNQPRKVWTIDDLDQLRARGLISIVGQVVSQAPTQAAAVPPEPTFPVYSSRLDDPEWYAEQAADLQAELDAHEAALQTQLTALALAADRITQPGVALDEPNAGVTVQAGIAVLQAQVMDVQDQLDELSDLARQHDIPPGVLRG